MPRSAEHYHRSELLSTVLAGGEDLVCSPRHKIQQILPSQVTALLESCRGFKTLSEHAADRCGPDAPARRVAAVRRLLEQLASWGFLESREEIVRACTRAARHEPEPPPLRTVAIVTCDRPAALERAVASYAENARRHGRPVQFVVMDDTRDPARARESRRRLSALVRRLGVTVRYGGWPERRCFATRLGRDFGLDPRLVSFALADPHGSGRAIGANRNGLLLQTAGSTILAADDDTVCRPKRPPRPDPRLRVDSGLSDEWWFFRRREEAERRLATVDTDVLGAHERLLGRSPAACVAASTEGVDLDRAREPLLERLVAGRGRVLLTCSGLWGDHAMPWVGWFLQLQGPSRDRLVRTLAEYEVALRRREVLRASPAPSVLASIECWAPIMGLDNRHLLPPFLPLGIGEDMTFCAAVARCFPYASQALVPLALLHAPVARRSLSRASTWKDASDVLLWDVVSLAIRSFETRVPADPAAALETVGEHLVGLSALPAKAFQDVVHDWVRERWLLRSALLRGIAREHRGRPGFWMRDVERQVRRLERAAPEADFAVPKDLAAGRGVRAAARLGQRIVGDFGRLLRAWPRLVAASRELVADGLGPAAPLGPRDAA